jgi:hypothetical protein
LTGSDIELHLLLEFNRRQIAERRMQPLLVVDLLVFERLYEALGRGVVIRVPGGPEAPGRRPVRAGAGAALGGVGAFLLTMVVCGGLEITFLPGSGQTGWVFTFVTVPVGMILGLVWLLRSSKG